MPAAGCPPPGVAAGLDGGTPQWTSHRRAAVPVSGHEVGRGSEGWVVVVAVCAGSVVSARSVPVSWSIRTVCGGGVERRCGARPWWSRQRVTGLRFWPGGAVPRCSRRYSSSVWGPSGMSGAGPAGAGGAWCCWVRVLRGRWRGGRVSVRMRVCRASTGAVVRVSPGGVGPGGGAVGGRGCTCQPGRCLMRWWRRHRQSRLSSRVGPFGQGRTWSRSQKTAATVQPGKRQRRSRARIRRAIRAEGRYRSAPARPPRAGTRRRAHGTVGRGPAVGSRSPLRRRVVHGAAPGSAWSARWAAVGGAAGADGERRRAGHR